MTTRRSDQWQDTPRSSHWAPQGVSSCDDITAAGENDAGGSAVLASSRQRRSSWARWQDKHPRQRPSNATEELKPKPLFGIKVSDTLKLSRLGYRY
jgi:hypothetical protein